MFWKKFQVILSFSISFPGFSRLKSFFQVSRHHGTISCVIKLMDQVYLVGQFDCTWSCTKFIFFHDITLWMLRPLVEKVLIETGLWPLHLLTRLFAPKNIKLCGGTGNLGDWVIRGLSYHKRSTQHCQPYRITNVPNGRRLGELLRVSVCSKATEADASLVQVHHPGWPSNIFLTPKNKSDLVRTFDPEQRSLSNSSECHHLSESAHRRASRKK